ncbi:MAG TPA: oligosaccharide flippase family protein, partial [Thermoanaerobaculia bacterium]|nr:oligosaccharide flippase family protein [Thermoanaerobaculia bacterium]
MSAQPLVQERERDGRGTLRRWAGILSAYFTSQTVTQLLGIATGLLFVNFMPVREYALYTLALSVTTFFNFASDLGSTTSLVHFFHRTRTEGTDFQP